MSGSGTTFTTVTFDDGTFAVVKTDPKKPRVFQVVAIFYDASRSYVLRRWRALSGPSRPTGSWIGTGLIMRNAVFESKTLPFEPSRRMVNMSMSNIGGAFKRNARSIESSARGRRAVAAAAAIKAAVPRFTYASGGDQVID